MSVTYRSAKIDDIPEIARMWESMNAEIMPACIKEHLDGRERERFIVHLTSAIYSETWIIIVICDEGTPVGFIGTEIMFQPYTHKPVANCHWLYVKPEHRGKRCAIRLIRESESRAKAMNVKIADFIARYDDETIRKWTLLGYEPTQVMFRKEI